MLQPYTPTRHLRSSSDNRLVVPPLKSAQTQHKLFSCLAPQWWNQLPTSIRDTVSPPSRKGKRDTCSGSTTLLKNVWLDPMFPPGSQWLLLRDLFLLLVSCNWPTVTIVLAVQYNFVACFFPQVHPCTFQGSCCLIVSCLTTCSYGSSLRDVFTCFIFWLPQCLGLSRCYD